MREVIRQKVVEGLASPVPPFTRRDTRIPRIAGKAVAAIGMRRTGKTTLLWQVLSDRLAAGTPREGLLYFSFEDERLGGMGAGELQWIPEEYYRLHPRWRDARRATFVFDEIQVVPGWETFARRILDTEKIDLFLSGSSARLLSREVATSMRGRAVEALVHPFSFREFLRHQGREPKDPPDRLTKAVRSGIEKDLRDYLSSGGFPEAQNLPRRDRFELLLGYVDVALLRDVIERHSVSHPTALRWMTRHLLGNAAGTFSINRFYGDLRSQGLRVAKDTLHDYLGYLEDAFLVRTVCVAGGSERRRMVNPRKAYPIDPGLIPVFDRSGRSNVGHSLETSILLDLDRRGAEINYVRTAAGLEVDFLARYPDREQELIQVCADLSDPRTRDREVNALLAAAREHPKARLCLVALESPGRIQVPRSISVYAASDWLLTITA
jgi:predicted AAA+ superfamily ATPase